MSVQLAVVMSVLRDDVRTGTMLAIGAVAPKVAMKEMPLTPANSTHFSRPCKVARGTATFLAGIIEAIVPAKESE